MFDSLCNAYKLISPVFSMVYSCTICVCYQLLFIVLLRYGTCLDTYKYYGAYVIPHYNNKNNTQFIGYPITTVYYLC